MRDDIPEAIRHSVSEPSRPKVPFILRVVGGAALVAIAIGALLSLRPKEQTAIQPTPPPPPIVNSNTSSPSSQVTSSSEPKPDQLLGHLTYNEAPLNELESITPDEQIKLRVAAAKAYQKMAGDAEIEGVHLVPISGFRSKTDQTNLFFKVKEERNQAVSKRAEVSAPPGHSEHHTGYAVDVGDAMQTETHLSQSFDTTRAFAWLSSNAAKYSFELSFPKGNAQGVSYEPWHWRFVGDQDSLETFYRAQNLKKQS
jgi:zinc D-Ala-D-Ala carboxypeptidase